MAGRSKMKALSPRVLEQKRQMIRADRLIDKLNRHIASKEGTMVPSAVTAALGLLRKVMPDLAAVEHSGLIETKPPDQMADAELRAAIAATEAQIRALTGGTETDDDPPIVH
jgi:hypothetical protein